MTLSTTVIDIIGEHHPAIFDLYGRPFGPKVHATTPARPIALRPAPLPPGIRSGIAAGFELAELARFHHATRSSGAVAVSDYCGDGERPRTSLTRPLPTVSAPSPDPGIDYHLGLAFALELTAHTWEHTALADDVEQVHVAALDETTRRLARG